MKRLNYLIFGVIFISVLITSCILFVPIDVNKYGVLLIINNENSLIVDKKISNFINRQQINTCSIEINKNYYYCSLLYAFNQDNEFVYNVTFNEQYEFSDQTSTVNVDYDSITIIKYLIYFV